MGAFLVRWAARAALLATAIVAMRGALDPLFEPGQMEVDPDEVAHLLFAYGLTLLALFAFPARGPWLAGALVGTLSLLLEIAQGSGVVVGSFEMRDLAVNALGVAAALLPMAAARARDLGCQPV